MMTHPTTLYRFFDAEGRLLYVGIAGNPGRRFSEHNKEKRWWDQVARSTMEHFATREEAAAAEVAAIVTEKPLHNVVHNRPEPSRRCTTGDRLMWGCTGCGQPIANGAGHIEVLTPRCPHQPRGRFMTIVDLIEEVDRQNAVLNAWQPVDLGAVLMPPRGAGWDNCQHCRIQCWEGWHWKCDPNPDADTYWIAVERIRTMQQLEDWDRHLWDKSWITLTNWSCVYANAKADPAFPTLASTHSACPTCGWQCGASSPSVDYLQARDAHAYSVTHNRPGPWASVDQ